MDLDTNHECRGRAARTVIPPSEAPAAAVPARERVAIVVPCRNEATRITLLLDGIRAQEVSVDDVVVVDTGSTDATRDIVAQYQRSHQDLPLTCLLRSGISVAAAVNVAIEVAQCEIIMRLDGHCRPRPDYVRGTLAALRATGAGVVGGAWEIVPGAPTRCAEAIAHAVSHPLGAGDAAYRTARVADGRMAVDTVPFGSFRKTTWQALGGFDEALLTKEDYEFNYRARSMGLRVVLDPQLRCTYFARGTLSELARQYFRYRGGRLGC